MSAMSKVNDDELMAIREQRRIAIQKQLEEQAAAQANAEIEAQHEAQENQQIDTLIRQILTNEARSRLKNLTYRCYKSQSIKKSLISLHQNSNLPPMSDDQLKSLPNNPRAAIVRQLEESEKVLRMSKNKPAAKKIR